MFKSYLEKASRFLEENRLSGIIIAFVGFVIIVLFSLTSAYEIFELKLYDLRFGIKPSIKEWDRLVFVDIDENSLTTIGEFPWPRSIYGSGLKALKQADAYQVTFDVMFPDSSPKHVNEPLLKSFRERMLEGAPVYVDELDEMVLDNDRLFADGISEMGNVLLSYTFTDDPPTDEVKKRLESPEYKQAISVFTNCSSVAVPEEKLADMEGLKSTDEIYISYPIPVLMNTAQGFGFVNRYTDADGVIRKVRLVRIYNGRLYFNLAMVMLMNACGVDINDVEIVPGERIVLKNALNPMNHVKGDIEIPVDEQGMMFVNWAGPGPREKSFRFFPYFGLVDYMYYAPAVHESIFKNLNGNFDKLNQRINSLKQSYAKAETEQDRKNIQDTLRDLRWQLAQEKVKVTDPWKDEIRRIEKDIQDKKDPRLSDDLAGLKDDLRAFDLVVNHVERDLADSIALIGLTATGTHDIGVIPISKEFPRVGTYHNTINTILNNEYIKRVPSAFNYFIMFVVAMLMGFFVQRLKARDSISMIVISFIGLNAIVIGSFALFNLWIDQLGISLALILPSVSITAIKLIKEETQKKFIKSAFSHYLAPGVIDEIISNPDMLELGGSNRNITIFFSDVAGFSSISEKLTPPQLVSLLNEYLSEMTDIILKYSGTVDKYEGDAIMAFWGAPQNLPDHALKCCLASIAMKRRLKEMQEVWRKAGRDELYVRMGINSGSAVVGNMGSRNRMDYTAMGDAVNLASRLEGANKFYKTYAMISGATFEMVKDHVEARKLDVIRVVGKEEPIPIFELMGEKGTLPDRIYEMLDVYYQGLELFGQREWKEARKTFKKALKIVEDDGPSLTYCDRCAEYMRKPPSASWDGVYRLKSK